MRRTASGKDALVGSGRTRSVNRPFFFRALSAGGGVAAARPGKKGCSWLRIRTAVRAKAMSAMAGTFLRATRESRAGTVVGLAGLACFASLHYAIRDYAVTSYGLAELLTDLALVLIAA